MKMTFTITLDVIPREGQTFQDAAKELTENLRESFMSGSIYEDFGEGWGGYDVPFYTVSDNT